MARTLHGIVVLMQKGSLAEEEVSPEKIWYPNAKARQLDGRSDEIGFSDDQDECRKSGSSMNFTYLLRLTIYFPKC